MDWFKDLLDFMGRHPGLAGFLALLIVGLVVWLGNAVIRLFHGHPPPPRYCRNCQCENCKAQRLDDDEN